ncbi:MAG: DUF4129 domain-containing protein [Armatimonadetes bacterium]|nr:DUF4129 domain-containing protein [Armatimonadota bacterium]
MAQSGHDPDDYLVSSLQARLAAGSRADVELLTDVLLPTALFGMLGALTWFLIDVRAALTEVPIPLLRFVFFMFMLAVVGIACIRRKSGAFNAAGYALGLLIAMLVFGYFFSYGGGRLGGGYGGSNQFASLVMNYAIIGFIWVAGNYIVARTTIDPDDVDAQSVGLLSSEEWEHQREGARAVRHRPHPGRTVMVFSVFAVVVFGVGHLLLARHNGEERHAEEQRHAFWCMVVYLGCALSVLAMSALSGLQIYVRQRGTRLPSGVFWLWLALALPLILLILGAAHVAPKLQPKAGSWAPDLPAPVERMLTSWRNAPVEGMRQYEGGETGKTSGHGDQGSSEQPGEKPGEGKPGDQPGGEKTGEKTGPGDAPDGSGGKGQGGQGGQGGGEESKPDAGQPSKPGGDKSAQGEKGRSEQGKPSGQQGGQQGSQRPGEPSGGKSQPSTPSDPSSASRPGESAAPSPPAPAGGAQGAAKIVLLVAGVLLVLLLLGWIAYRLLKGGAWRHLMARLRALFTRGAAGEPPPPTRDPFVDPFGPRSQLRGRPASELVSHVYRAFQAYAALAGCPRRPEITAHEFLHDLPPSMDSWHPQIRALTDLYAAAEYTPDSVDEGCLPELRTIWERLMQAVREVRG